MGKSNRIRKDRANEMLARSATPKKKSQGMPSWALNLITILVAAVILFSVAFSLLSANGVFTRMQTAMKTENFRVNANMMKYFFQTQYQSFVSENSSYLSYYGLDTGVSLKDQTVSTGENAQTWFDYMMDSTEAQVKELLIYCEEAEARGIKLEDADKASIDSQLEMIETYAQMYGYTTSSYIASMYGKGVNASDVRKCLELSTLATKCGQIIGEEVEGGITDSDIDTEYGANKLDYDLVDMLTYTFTVNYSDAKAACEDGADDATVIAKYKELIEKAKEDAKKLLEAKTEDEFKDIIADYIVSDAYDEIYEDAVDESDVAEADQPSAENTAAIKTALLAHIADLIKNDKDFNADDVVSAEFKVVSTEVTVTEAFAKLLKEIAKDIYDDAVSHIEASLKEKVAHSESDESTKWAFEDGRAVGNTKLFETGDSADGAELSATASELKSYSGNVVYVVKTEYRNEVSTKNVGIAVFSSKELADAAIGKLSAGVGIESFEQICTESSGSFSKYENYVKGSLGVAAFDTWLYGDGVALGSYTATAISASESSYVVALYYADGEPEWKVTVKSAVYSERYDAKLKDMTEKYAVTQNDKVIAKIDA